jgi:hypothetical protein
VFCGCEFQGMFVRSGGGLDEDCSTGDGETGSRKLRAGGGWKSQVCSFAGGAKGW